MQKLSKKLLEKRRQRGETAAQAAKILKVSAATLSHWETEKTKPKVRHWHDIAQYLGIDISEVWGLISDGD